MEEVTIYDLKPDNILKIVKELREEGYTLGIDFDYYYKPSTDSFFDGNYQTTKRHTIFKFYNEQYASWFALKYG